MRITSKDEELLARVKLFNKYLLTSYHEQTNAVAWDLFGFSTQYAMFQETPWLQKKPLGGPITYLVLKELEEVLETMVLRHSS